MDACCVFRLHISTRFRDQSAAPRSPTQTRRPCVLRRTRPLRSVTGGVRLVKIVSSCATVLRCRTLSSNHSKFRKPTGARIPVPYLFQIRRESLRKIHDRYCYLDHVTAHRGACRHTGAREPRAPWVNSWLLCCPNHDKGSGNDERQKESIRTHLYCSAVDTYRRRQEPLGNLTCS